MGLALIFGCDALLAPNPPLAAKAVLDELAHATTALLLLDACGLNTSVRRRWIVAITAVVIDVDHVPAVLGYRFLTRHVPRPYSHSLLSVLVVVAVAVCFNGRARSAILAVAFGLLAHFARDVATGPISLLWPLSDYGFRVPYWWYAALMILSAAIVCVRPRQARL